MWTIPTSLPPNEAYVWVRNVFTPAEMDLIISIGEESLIDATVDNQVKPESRRSKISWIAPTPSTEFIFQKLSGAIAQANKAYYNYDLTVIEDLQFSEYDESYTGMYKSHTDDGYESDHNRKLSFSIQLSDPSDYAGGDLQLYRFKLEDPIVVEKEKGLAAFFPSFTIHEVTPVTRGKRYALVGWVHGPKFR
jgi:PKHD-type hydroxylase